MLNNDSRNKCWKQLRPECAGRHVEDVKTLEDCNEEILILLLQPGFDNLSKQDFNEVMTIHQQELTNDELM